MFCISALPVGFKCLHALLVIRVGGSTTKTIDLKGHDGHLWCLLPTKRNWPSIEHDGAPIQSVIMSDEARHLDPTLTSTAVSKSA
jgi:hypothetical protein